MIVLFGGGLGYTGYNHWGWQGNNYGGGIGLGTILLIVLVVLLLRGRL